MTVTNSIAGLPVHTGLDTTPPAAPKEANAAAATAPALPHALEGLARRMAGPQQADPRHRQLRAQLPPLPSASEALLRPYTFEHPVAGNSKTLLAIDAPFWRGGDAQLAAHRIVLEAVQSHVKRQIDSLGVAAAPGGALERFASGQLDHVYVDTQHFKQLAAAARSIKGQPDKYPLYVDTQRGQLVINIESAFAANDELSAAAERGLSQALGLGNKGLDFLPRYQGHAVNSTTRGADFFKPNAHPQLHGEQPNGTAFAHPHYFESQSTKALGKEIVVHRGMFDNRNGIPENSPAAIDNAYKAGYRSLELDIEVTKDGVPVLMHDFTVGRMTQDPQNRLVSHVEWSELKNKHLVIRNPVDGNFVETDQKVASVKEALLDVARTKPDMSIALDCKEQTAEAAFDLLKNEPELRRFTALKLYAKAYPGGFDQFLGNLYERYNIDPTSAEGSAKRQDLLQTLKETKVEPVFSAGMVTDPTIHQLYPSKAPQQSPLGCAESALTWLQGWNAMDIKVIEAPPSESSPLVNQAMDILRQRLADKDSDLSHAASSAAYRSEDFSVPERDGSRKFFTNQIFGLMRDVTNDADAAKSETAGSLRRAGENVLTDQPQEEVYATLHDTSLARGHSGLVLDVAPGTAIDTERNKEIVDLRVKVFGVEKQQLDVQRIAAVRAGRAADKAGTAKPEAKSVLDNPWVVGTAATLGVAATAYAGAKLGPEVLRAGTAGGRRKTT